MKLTVLLFTVGLLQLHASGVSQTITLSGKNLSLKKIFAVVEAQTGYVLFSSKKMLADATVVTVSAKDMPLSAFLGEVLAEQSLVFDIQGKTITLSKKPALEADLKSAANALYFLPIIGRLTDSAGQPLAGISVVLKGTKNGTTTDASGIFSINAEAGQALVISSVEYETQEVKLTPEIIALIASSDREANRLLFSIKLVKAVTLLDDVRVVSTGYQTLPKERATGSFTQIDNKLFNQQVGTDILSRLSAVGNGLLIDNRIGAKGQLMVRGLSTIRGPKAPLVVVDNFAYDGDLTNINPNDVNSITVLKDAAAASIWGARAGNGVIVITTRNGLNNQPITIDVNANVTYGAKPNLGYIQQMSSSDFIDVEQMLFDKGYYNSQITSSSKPVLSPVVELLLKRRNGEISGDEATALINPMRNIDIKDQFDQHFYQYSFNQQYALNLRGGTDNMAWVSSAGYDENKSNLNASYSRLNLRFQNIYKPIKNLEILTGVYYTQSKSINGQLGYGSISSSSNGIYPYALFADEKGNALAIPKGYRQSYLQTAGNGRLLDWKYYPLEDYKHNQTKNLINDLLLNSGVTYQILKGLKIDLKYQYERQNSDNSTLNDLGSYETRNYINRFTQISSSGEVSYKVPMGSTYSFSNEVLQSHNFRGQLNFDRTWAKHNITAIAGGEQRSANTKGLGDKIYGYNESLLTFGNVDFINQHRDFVTGTNSFIQNNRFVSDKTTRYLSTYANAAYTYDTKYTLSLSARRDASNLFGLNIQDQWNPFWSAGAGWVLSNESFYKFKFLPYAKLRATIGLSGNIDPAMVAVTTTTVLGTSPFSLLPYSRFSNYYNPELQWETSKMFNLGLDFRIIDSKLTGSLEYYQKVGKNLFGTEMLDYTSGIGASIVKNVASMKSKGLDIELRSSNLNRRLVWNTILNFSYNNDRVTEYYVSSLQGSRFINTTSVAGLKGYPVYSMFAYRSAGLDPVNGDPRGYLNGEISKNYSSLTGADTEIKDLRYFGSILPTKFGSLINSFSYHNFTLDVNLSYKLGYYIRRNSINYSTLLSEWKGHSDFENRWQVTGDENHTNVPSFIYPTSSARNNFYMGSESLVDKGDHIRLQYVNVNYSLSEKWLKSGMFKTFSVYANISNIGIVWRANKYGIDPDSNYGPSATPVPTTYSIGLRTHF